MSLRERLIPREAVSTLLLCSLCCGLVTTESLAQSNAQEILVFTSAAPAESGPESVPQYNADKTTANLQGHKPKAKYDISKIGKRSIGKGLDFYSAGEERELGQQIANAIERSITVIDDAVISDYLNGLAQRLVRNSDAKVPFVVKVLDTDEINAFALPGGFLFVDRGLILAAENEAVLAGAMAHEIAHVAARHATRGATRAQILDALSLSMIFVSGPLGLAAHGLNVVTRPLTTMRFSRNAEREADLLALEYEYAAGYDPEQFVGFLEAMSSGETKKRSLFSSAFATHPMTSDRVRLAQQEIATYLPDRDQYLVDTSEFQQIKARLSDIRPRVPKLRSSNRP